MGGKVCKAEEIRWAAPLEVCSGVEWIAPLEVSVDVELGEVKCCVDVEPMVGWVEEAVWPVVGR